MFKLSAHSPENLSLILKHLLLVGKSDKMPDEVKKDLFGSAEVTGQLLDSNASDATARP